MLPNRSAPENLKTKAFTTTPIRKARDRINNQSIRELRKVVKEVMAMREVLKRSENPSSASMGGLSAVSKYEVLYPTMEYKAFI